MLGYHENRLGKILTRVANRDACATRCIVQPVCKSFSYSERKQRCHLFGAVDAENVDLVQVVESSDFDHYPEGVHCAPVALSSTTTATTLKTTVSTHVPTTKADTDAGTYSKPVNKGCSSCTCSSDNVKVIELWGLGKVCKCTCRLLSDFSTANAASNEVSTPVTATQSTTPTVPADADKGIVVTTLPSKSERTCEDLGWRPSPILPLASKDDGNRETETTVSCAASKIDGSCPVNDTMSRPAAEAWCLAAGARLCTQLELQRGAADGTGCDLDDKYVWTGDLCGGPSNVGNINSRMHAITLGGAQRNAAAPRTICATESVATIAGARCCADMASAMTGLTWVDVPQDAALFSDASSVNFDSSQSTVPNGAEQTGQKKKNNKVIMIATGSVGVLCLVAIVALLRKRIAQWTPGQRAPAQLGEPELKHMRRLFTDQSNAPTEYDNIIHANETGCDVLFTQINDGEGTSTGPSIYYRHNILEAAGHISGFTESNGGSAHSSGSCGTILEEDEEAELSELDDVSGDFLPEMVEDDMFALPEMTEDDMFASPGTGGFDSSRASCHEFVFLEETDGYLSPANVSAYMPNMHTIASMSSFQAGDGIDHANVSMHTGYASDSNGDVGALPLKKSVSVSSRIPTMSLGVGSAADPPPTRYAPVRTAPSVDAALPPAARGHNTSTALPFTAAGGVGGISRGSTSNDSPDGERVVNLADVWADDSSDDDAVANVPSPYAFTGSTTLPGGIAESNSGEYVTLEHTHTMSHTIAEDGEYLLLEPNTNVPASKAHAAFGGNGESRQGSKLSMVSSSGGGSVNSDNSALWDHCYDVYADVISFKEKMKKHKGSGASLGSQGSTGSTNEASGIGEGSSAGGSSAAATTHINAMPEICNVDADGGTGTNKGASWLVDQDAMLAEAVEKRRRSSERAKAVATAHGGGVVVKQPGGDADTHV